MIRYFIEGQYLTRDALAAHLEVSRLEVETVTQPLLQDGVLVKKVGSNGLFAFRYVGLILLADVTIYVRPKILSSSSVSRPYLAKETSLVLSAVRTYAAREDTVQSSEAEMFAGADGSGNISDFMVMVALMRHWDEYGLHTANVSATEVNGSGEIDWSSTIADQSPFPVKSQIVYVDLSTRRVMNSEMDFVRRVHKSCVVQIANYLRSHGLQELAPCDVDFSAEAGLLERREECLRAVSALEHRTYNDVDRERLRLISAYLMGRVSFANVTETIYVGVRKFDRIWETACSYVLGNQASYAPILEAVPALEFSPNAPVLPDTSQLPQWEIDDRVEQGRALEMDIALTGRATQGGLPYLVIVDAKYYSTYTSRGLSGLPGTPDVVKQFIYELALHSRFPDGDLAVRNVFLFPGIEEVFVTVGAIRLDYFSSLGLSDILLYRVSLMHVLRGYVTDREGCYRSAFLSELPGLGL